VQGYSENEYKPNQAATKEEFLTMLSKVKTLERSESNYKERRNEIPLTIDNSDWSYYYIKDSLNGLSLFEKEFVLGKNPDFTQEITREEAAGILAMALDLKVDENRTANFKDINTTLHRKEIEAVYANNIMSGYNNDAFGPTNQLTRAELAAVFHKILTNDLARQLIKK
ncbi:MAG: S-layer homology domain-containing protein, partial [Thermotaleaceae bacterium]